MSNITAAPAPFKLGDQDFLMSPLTDRDIQEVNNFIKQDILTAAREGCKNETNIIIVQAMMKAAMEQASKVDWIMDSTLLQTIDRLTYLIWIGTRNNNPKMTRVSFAKLFMEDWEKNIDICMEALQNVNPSLLRKKMEQKVTEE